MTNTYRFALATRILDTCEAPSLAAALQYALSLSAETLASSDVALAVTLLMRTSDGWAPVATVVAS